MDPKRILFHGEGLLAVDKPAGIPVHRGTKHPRGLCEEIEEWARRNPGRIELTPGCRVRPLHRLDLEASGVVLLGLLYGVAPAIQAAFAAGEVRKRYLAFVAGPVDREGSIRGKVRTRLRGVYCWLPAEIDFRRLEGDERLSLVEVVPRRGRTHQIRSLFAGAGLPLAGDLRYGKPKPARQFLSRFQVPYLLLHARELTLPAEALGSSRTFSAPPPEEFRRVAAQKGWDIPEISS